MSKQARINISIFVFIAIFVILSAYPTKSSAMETFVEKIYDDKVSYTRGKFDSVQNENGYFLTHPFKPQKPMRQSILNSNIEPQGLAFEARSKESILNPNMDGRKKVEDTKLWPYSICTQVRMEYGNYTCNGSGVLISSHHVLTAAHNVYDLKKEHNPNNRVWADSGVVYPGLSETRAIFGSAKVARVYIFREWFDNENDHYDCAILVLDQPIGLHTGWGGLFGLDNEGDIFSKKISITGYPGDKEFNQMWTMEHNIKNVEAEMFLYEIDTCYGQSGSPIWTLQENGPYIIGVHTLGCTNMNYGARLSRYKFNEIVNWVNKTRHIVKEAKDTYIPLVAYIPIPSVALGNEGIYFRFLNGKLIYRPNVENDVGKIELPIAALANPFEGTFDLSKCGDMGKYLSISTGYRKGKKSENADKIEIWFCPRFLVEKEIANTASHFKEIFPSMWKDSALVGIFWTWGSWDKLGWYDYLINENMDNLSKVSLYENWKKCHRFTSPLGTTSLYYSAQSVGINLIDSFSCSFP